MDERFLRLRMEQFLAGESGRGQNLPGDRCSTPPPAAMEGEARTPCSVPSTKPRPHLALSARFGGRSPAARRAFAPRSKELSESSYDEVFRRVETNLQGAREHISRELSAASAQWQRLKGHPQARRLLMVRNDPRFQTWGLIELLLDHSRAQSERHPHLGQELAQLALAIADRLPAESYGDERMADLRCAALTELGNARRIAGNYQGAGLALAQAKAHFDFGSGDLLDKANLAQREFELLRDQGRLDEAAAALDQAKVLFRVLGDDRLRGVSLRPQPRRPAPRGSSRPRGVRRA